MRMPPISLVALALVAGAAPVRAQVANADLIACAVIARDADRLACYDKAVAASSAEARAASTKRAAESARIAAAEAAAAAETARVKAIADAAAAAEAKREAFGAEAVASRGKARFAPDPGEIQEIETSVTEVFTNRSGQGVFLLENGQLWRQIETLSPPNVRVGDKVLLSRAPLGGYHLTFLRTKRWELVKRVR